ncbi:IS66 family insertion sequence element accessory protein TnpB [Spartinivicinus ruber]|uniref:IS66 family insertion sequence element accessory protein TnpB n=1 Tax=Spartinivicinus ruber TaxID=2683272 RepID=UPI0013D47024|nr:IS66 family insertion sequence element accessory protein TnpB [Spartinivicinus ruber]
MPNIIRLQLTHQHRLLLSVKPVDFRKGINGLIALCQLQLNERPDSEPIFSNRGKDKAKLLVYHGQGVWLCMKGFSQGKLKWRPKAEDTTYKISIKELQILLYQCNSTQAANYGRLKISCCLVVFSEPND